MENNNDTINLKLNLLSEEVCPSTAIDRVTFIIDNPNGKAKVIKEYKMKNKYIFNIRAFLWLGIFTTLCSITAKSQNNKSEINSDTLSEMGLYFFYGLEANQDVYEFLHKKLKRKKVFEEACQQEVVSDLIGVRINVADERVEKAYIQSGWYNPAFDSTVCAVLTDKKCDFQMCSKSSRGYDFRIEVIKLCVGEDFSPTPPKDSTLKIVRAALSNRKRLIELNKSLQYVIESSGDQSDLLYEELEASISDPRLRVQLRSIQLEISRIVKKLDEVRYHIIENSEGAKDTKLDDSLHTFNYVLDELNEVNHRITELEEKHELECLEYEFCQTWEGCFLEAPMVVRLALISEYESHLIQIERNLLDQLKERYKRE